MRVVKANTHGGKRRNRRRGEEKTERQRDIETKLNRNIDRETGRERERICNFTTTITLWRNAFLFVNVAKIKFVKRGLLTPM